MEPVYCVGDSHSCVFSGTQSIFPAWPYPAPQEHPIFRARHIGPRTAYNFKTERCDVVLHTLDPGAVIMLCLGEIDCYLHLHQNSVSTGRELRTVVEECVTRYIETVVDIQHRGFVVLVHNVVPSQPRDDWEATTRRRYRDTYNTDKEFALPKENETNMLFNEYLARHCSINNIPFVNTWNAFVGPDDSANLDFKGPDKHHLGLNALPIVLAAVEKHGIFRESARPFQ